MVLSRSGDEPIFAPLEEYHTSDGAGAGTGAVKNKNTNMKRAKGLAGTASMYQAEQQLAGLMTAEARSVSYDVLFDADSFLGEGSQ